MKLSYLLKGTPGHPSHPPLTDAVIGIFAFATIAGVADVTGISDDAATHGWWLALLTGLIAAVPTLITGFADWLDIRTGSPLWSTATIHGASNVVASILFALAALTGKESFDTGDISTLPMALTLAGFGFLTLGGYLGGTIVYVYGMRVLELGREPAREASSPIPPPEHERAERG